MTAPTRPTRTTATRPAARPTPPRTIGVRQARPLCPRIVMYAVEGFGKTTFGAHAPDPVLLMARGEQGYDTLLSAGLVPAIPADVIGDFKALMHVIGQPIPGCKTLVLDGFGGFERLTQEFVCAEHFDNEWGEKGFASYGKGFDLSAGQWLQVLQALDRRNAEGMTVVLLGHARVKSFKNPMGADFDRYECDVHQKVWASTARWADAVLFGNFHTIVDASKREEKKNIAERKGKGIGGTDRVVYAERRDAFDAKNRFGMMPAFTLESDPAKGGGPASMWSQIWNEIVRPKAE